MLHCAVHSKYRQKQSGNCHLAGNVPNSDRTEHGIRLLSAHGLSMSWRIIHQSTEEGLRGRLIDGYLNRKVVIGQCGQSGARAANRAITGGIANGLYCLHVQLSDD